VLLLDRFAEPFAFGFAFAPPPPFFTVDVLAMPTRLLSWLDA
jgi:hypothetical protein